MAVGTRFVYFAGVENLEKRQTLLYIGLAIVFKFDDLSTAFKSENNNNNTARRGERHNNIPRPRSPPLDLSQLLSIEPSWLKPFACDARNSRPEITHCVYYCTVLFVHKRKLEKRTVITKSAVLLYDCLIQEKNHCLFGMCNKL